MTGFGGSRSALRNLKTLGPEVWHRKDTGLPGVKVRSEPEISNDEEDPGPSKRRRKVRRPYSLPPPRSRRSDAQPTMSETAAGQSAGDLSITAAGGTNRRISCW